MCDYCHGVGCLHCQPETDSIPCPHCCGTGGVKFYRLKETREIDWEEIDFQEYQTLPEDLRDIEKCPHCGGTGTITVPYDRHKRR